MKKQTEEQIFQVPMAFGKGDDMILEFYICKTNEINPHRDIRELGIVVYEKDKTLRESDEFRQMDNCNEFDVEEIEKLIKFLNKAKRQIKKFNENSKPTENAD